MNKYENQQLFKHLHTTIAATGTKNYKFQFCSSFLSDILVAQGCSCASVTRISFCNEQPSSGKKRNTGAIFSKPLFKHSQKIVILQTLSMIPFCSAKNKKNVVAGNLPQFRMLFRRELPYAYASQQSSGTFGVSSSEFNN